MDQVLKDIYAGVIDGQSALVQEKVKDALASGLNPGIILNEGMIAAMREVGRRFEEGEFYVPEMLIAARAMQSGLALLKPHLQQSDIKSAGKVVIGTVKGDLHDIGKNLVAMMLEGAGFEIYDLGTDVTPQKFIETARSVDADIIAMSALLTTTMTNMKVTIDALTEAGLRSSLKVMVGGAPITDQYAAQIGADGYAVDASRAVSVAKSLLSD
ncbi:MAG: methyltransferase [Chloroflexi bacterium RBG_19FT_COMBO_55_16]|nr:MAG: methyltransferase [Chloroflexi bacterium RBG_19FT_COMBO_55_16]